MQIVNDRILERNLRDDFLSKLAPLIKTTAEEIKTEREECARKWCNMGGLACFIFCKILFLI